MPSSKLNRVELANQPEEIISVVGEPPNWTVAGEYCFHSAVSEDDKRFQGSNCITNCATPGEIIDVTRQWQAHKIDPFQCGEILIAEQWHLGGLPCQPTEIKLIGLRGRMADRMKLDVVSGASKREFHEQVEPLGPTCMTDEPDLDLSGRG